MNSSYRVITLGGESNWGFDIFNVIYSRIFDGKFLCGSVIAGGAIKTV